MYQKQSTKIQSKFDEAKSRERKTNLAPITITIGYKINIDSILFYSICTLITHTHIEKFRKIFLNCEVYQLSNH